MYSNVRALSLAPTPTTPQQHSHPHGSTLTLADLALANQIFHQQQAAMSVAPLTQYQPPPQSMWGSHYQRMFSLLGAPAGVSVNVSPNNASPEQYRLFTQSPSTFSVSVSPNVGTHTHSGTSNVSGATLALQLSPRAGPASATSTPSPVALSTTTPTGTNTHSDAGNDSKMKKRAKLSHHSTEVNNAHINTLAVPPTQSAAASNTFVPSMPGLFDDSGRYHQSALQFDPLSLSLSMSMISQSQTQPQSGLPLPVLPLGGSAAVEVKPVPSIRNNTGPGTDTDNDSTDLSHTHGNNTSTTNTPAHTDGLSDGECLHNGRRKHIFTDRQRRARIKQGMDELRNLLLEHGSFTTDQVSIMMASINLIRRLKQEKLAVELEKKRVESQYEQLQAYTVMMNASLQQAQSQSQSQPLSLPLPTPVPPLSAAGNDSNGTTETRQLSETSNGTDATNDSSNSEATNLSSVSSPIVSANITNDTDAIDTDIDADSHPSSDGSDGPSTDTDGSG